ncbi:MAG: hypothetical protein KGZ96_08660 [Clostridia bacterium]|jgi:hypothetical protein|nr:hypothetical protein [Clostridia bacterium]
MNKYIKKYQLLSLVGILMFAFLLTGCPARRPIQEAPVPPETIIVPEVARIFFTEVPLEDGPELARLLAANNRGGEMTVWFEADDNIWVMVQAAEGSDEVLRIEEVLQRIPGRDTLLLEIRINEVGREEVPEEKGKEGQEGEQPRGAGQFGDVKLVRLDFNQRPHGIAFLFDSRLEKELEVDGNGVQERAAQPPAPGPQAQQPQPQGQQAQQPPAQEQNFIQVQEPRPGQEVTSPLQVLGRARVPGGAVHFRLKNGNGEVIAESSTTATATAPQAGTFSGILSFSPPGGETNGTLEVFSNGRNGQPETLVAVPVVIK